MSILIRVIVTALLITALANNSYAQLIVRVKPDKPATSITKPEAPSTVHVWVEEDWKIKDKKYEFKGGYYVEPPKTGAEWVKGRVKN